MINCIVAIDKNQGIGYENKLPWPLLKEDMSWFKEKTTNNIVLMGSKTWLSLSQPLINRINVVISSKIYPNANLIYNNISQAINDLQERFLGKDIYIIGGGQIYESIKGLVDNYYITEINEKYICDTFFDLTYVRENYKLITEIRSFDKAANTPAFKITEYSK